MATVDLRRRRSRAAATRSRRRPPRRRGRGRALAVAAVAVLAAWVDAAAVVRVAHHERVLPGTTMAGADLGGATAVEARARLLAALRARPRPVLVVAGRRLEADPERLGHAVDVRASVARALRAGREGPLLGAWSTLAALVAPRALEPVARLDPVRLEGEVAAIARTVDRPVEAGAIAYDGSAPGLIRTLAPRSGRALDRRAARAAIAAALGAPGGAPVTLPVRLRPAPSRAAVEAVARRARRYLRAPLTLGLGARTLTLRAPDVGPLLAAERAGGSRALRLGVDRERVRALVGRLADRIDRAPRDARIGAPATPPVTLADHGDVRWRPRAVEVSVRPARPGRRLRRARAATAIAAAVRAGRHRAALPVQRVRPRIATRAARRVDALLGTFTTRYACCQPRVRNIHRIAATVDGTTVAAGERFSLNAVTGPRTTAGGYVRAPFIADGRLELSVGGGVSQFATTVYNAAFFAGLRLDAHRPHSFYIDRYPPGREATLNHPDIDLAWTNDTGAPVLVRAAVDATSVTVSLYGADDGRRVRAITGSRVPIAGGDFAITVTRELRRRGGATARQAHTTRYDRPPPPE